MYDYEGPTFDLESGVPQASILGPTLYFLYTNDTPEPELNNLTLMFTDDVTQIITTDKTKKHLSSEPKRKLKNKTNIKENGKSSLTWINFH